MLIAKIDHGRIHVEGNGPLDDVIADVSQVIGAIYAQMMTADHETAQEFRKMITILLVDHDSPVWQMSPAVGGVASAIPTDTEEA